MTYEAIETAETRLRLAKIIASELDGKCPERGLTIKKIGEYTIVDDEQDRWIDTTDNYDESANMLLRDVLNGKYDRHDDDAESVQWYSDFCMANSCLYSRFGTPGNINALFDYLDGIDEILEISEALGIDDESLPATVRILVEAGERFSGSDPVGEANKWIENGFAIDETEEWIGAGFWDARAALACKEAGLDASDVVAASEALVEIEWEGGMSPYTDWSPIYSVCNGDTDVQVLIEAAKNTN